MAPNGQNVAINVLNPALDSTMPTVEFLLEMELVNLRNGLELGLKFGCVIVMGKQQEEARQKERKTKLRMSIVCFFFVCCCFLLFVVVVVLVFQERKLL